MNFYNLIPKQNFPDLIDGIRAKSRILVIGPSGNGKTNSVMNFIFNTSKHGYFNRICICTKNSDEPLYNFLKSKSKGQIEFFENGELPDIQSFNPAEHNLVILDDLLCESNKKQKEIGEFFIYGRKRGITLFYLSQSYYALPKLIRLNCNYIWIKRLNSIKDLKLILKEYSMSNDLTEIMKLYNECTKDFLKTLNIDLIKNEFNIRV